MPTIIKPLKVLEFSGGGAGKRNNSKIKKPSSSTFWSHSTTARTTRRRTTRNTIPRGLLFFVAFVTCLVPTFFVLFLPFFDGESAATITTNSSSSSVDSAANYFHSSHNVSSSAFVRQQQQQQGGYLRSAVARERRQLDRALRTLKHLGESNLPARVRALREERAVVGERLREVHDGIETVEEVLHSHGHGHGLNQSHRSSSASLSALPPMELDEVVEYLDSWIHLLHETLLQQKQSTYEEIWQAYHDLVVKTLYPWDQEYLRRMPTRRDDGSIFLSLASYRDENCPNTIYQAYNHSKDPDKLFVGLVQQNCHRDCRSGVMKDASVHDVPPDDSCYELFCKSDLGLSICAKKQVRLLDVDEAESLGPYAARFFASKLWYGESWFMQTDAHMTFAQDWDATSVAMLKRAPSEKPILSHYPVPHTVDLDSPDTKSKPGARLCGPVFSTGSVEAQMIRLEGGGYDRRKLEVPAFAPFTAAGYFVAHGDFLREVPFDPFLPWIFMGEEIIMSSRFWTAGYDIFSPTTTVVGHIYGRRQKPKFWESVNRAFTYGVHNPLKMMVLDRIKHQLGYPESARDMLPRKSLLTAVEQYSMGTARPLEDYLRLVGLNMTTKEVTYTGWCEDGMPPPGFEQYNHLYPASRAKEIKDQRRKQQRE